jgi:hypothetical protein
MTVVASVGWVQKDLGANHFMWTHADLHDNNWLTGETRTATFTWFGGYTGQSWVIVFDANDVVLARTPAHRYGVDGTWIGVSDRTDPWSDFVGDGIARPGVRLQVAQSWVGLSLDDIVRVGEKVAPFAAALFF